MGSGLRAWWGAGWGAGVWVPLSGAWVVGGIRFGAVAVAVAAKAVVVVAKAVVVAMAVAIAVAGSGLVASGLAGAFFRHPEA